MFEYFQRFNIFDFIWDIVSNFSTSIRDCIQLIKSMGFFYLAQCFLNFAYIKLYIPLEKISPP